MKKIITFLNIVSLALLLIIFNNSFAEDLKTLLNNLKTMQANFTQIVYDNHGKAVQQSYGQMALSRPGKFRWEVKKPIPQLIIASNTRLTIYDPDLEQVTIRALKLSTGDTPALLLSHENTTLERDFKVRNLPKVQNIIWFELIPKGHDSMFASIRMGFFGGQITQMLLQDHLGHTTKVKFANAKLNQSVPDNLFIFRAPRGADVIDETRKS